MPTRNYSQLLTLSSVEDADLIAGYRSTGPLKTYTALVFKSYVGADYMPLTGGTFTGKINLAVGSEGAPNGFGSETNTGIYRSGAGAWDVSILGTRRLGLTATGLDVYGNLTISGTLSGGSYSGAVLSTALTKSSDYTLIITDLGKSFILSGVGTLTIPAYASVALPAGCEIYLYCLTGPTAIAITSDNLVWYTGSAVNTGARTIASGGWARLYKYTTTTWIITGAGIT